MTLSGDRQLETRARRRRRLTYVLWSLPVVIALLYVAARLIGLSVDNQIALGLYDRGSYAASADKSTTLLDETIIEPYVPWFNRGDAYAAQEKYTDAIDDFERALDLAPAEKKCDVRVNLALSWEKLGDIYIAGGYPDGAKRLYQAAKTVIEQGTNCPRTEAAGQNLDVAGPRVQAKIDEAQRQADAADSADGQDGPGGLQQQLDQLGQKSDAGAEEKANGDSADRGQQNNQGGYTDKPW